VTGPDTGVYGWSTGTGGVHFFRVAEPLRVAHQGGIRVGWGQRLDDAICEAFDTVLVHMLWDERNSEAWEQLAAGGHHRLVLDIDDWMWEPDWEPFRKHYTPTVLDRVYRNVKLAHVITTPSPRIADHLSRYNPNVHVVPNTVPEYVLRLRPPARRRPAIGYQGSPSHAGDFDGIYPALIRFLAEHPDWDAHGWGGNIEDPEQPRPDWLQPWRHDQLAQRWIEHPWQPNVKRYYTALSMDIGLGPLRPTPFNRAKSALRAIEYAALGIPGVFTDLDPYTDWVQHGHTGYLIAPGDDWGEILCELGCNPTLRARISTYARAQAHDWTTEANGWRWVQAWNTA
jgi:glycosyltransferase involved in cell wall biosynthesis